MATRLSRYTRSAIVERALEYKFTPLEIKQTAAGKALALRLMRHTLGEEHWKLLPTLPQGWLPVVESIGVNVVGKKMYFAWEGPLPGCVECVTVEAAHPMRAELERYMSEELALRADKESLRGKLRAVVGSYSSEEALAMGWPDGARFIHARTITPAGLPAVSIDVLNAELGLPEKAA